MTAMSMETYTCLLMDAIPEFPSHFLDIYSQDLIGPAGGVVALLPVNDIVQVPTRSVPEAVVEGLVGQLGVLG